MREKREKAKDRTERIAHFCYIVGSMEIAVGLFSVGVTIGFDVFLAKVSLGVAGTFLVFAGILLILATYNSVMSGKQIPYDRSLWDGFTISWHRRMWHLDKLFLFSDLCDYCAVLSLVCWAVVYFFFT